MWFVGFQKTGEIEDEAGELLPTFKVWRINLETVAGFNTSEDETQITVLMGAGSGQLSLDNAKGDSFAIFPNWEEAEAFVEAFLKGYTGADGGLEEEDDDEGAEDRASIEDELKIEEELRQQIKQNDHPEVVFGTAILNLRQWADITGIHLDLPSDEPSIASAVTALLGYIPAGTEFMDEDSREAYLNSSSKED